LVRAVSAELVPSVQASCTPRLERPEEFMDRLGGGFQYLDDSAGDATNHRRGATE
jgi:hypothetical protein